VNFLEKLKAACRALSPNCREAIRAQSEQLDGPLSPVRRVGLWLHLLLCRWCRRYGRHIQLLHQATHEHQDALTKGTPETLSDPARERIKQRLRAAQAKD
jgi:hypothetical protein